MLGILIAALGAAQETTSFSKNIGPVQLTPSGFIESIGTVRSATTHDDVSTRFGSIPLENTPTEGLVSLRNSRIALQADAPFAGGSFTGYLETDFLNRPPQEPYRFRQYWGQLKFGDWEILGGQAWSLLRPNRHGIASDTDLMNTLVVDAGYHVGLLGYRDQQVRVVRHMGNWTAGLSFENARDFLPKMTHDGKYLHLEVTGVAGRFGHYGASVAGVVHATRKVDVVAQQYWSKGGGPDALGVVPAGVKTYSTLDGVEAKIGKGVRAFAYGGIVYGARSAGNRDVRQWSVGCSREFLPGYGFGNSLFSMEYSQLDRSLWGGPQGAEQFVMVSMRHYFGAAK